MRLDLSGPRGGGGAVARGVRGREPVAEDGADGKGRGGGGAVEVASVGVDAGRKRVGEWCASAPAGFQMRGARGGAGGASAATERSGAEERGPLRVAWRSERVRGSDEVGSDAAS